MATADFKRKLTAVFSADVVGYSRLMGEDEAETVKTLEIYKGVMFTLIRQHRGRVIDSPGDNLLAEFASVVDAVQCAVAVQKELQARNGDLPDNRKMEFRIGINLGDVIEEQERIYGDGVNIAARLEALAEPGGICVSKTAFDHIESKLPLGYRFLGEQTVKNIAKPVGACKVLMETRVIDEKGEKKEAKEIPLSRRTPVLASGVALILALIAALIWNVYFRPAPVQVATKEKAAPQAPAKPEPAKPALKLPDKPSIAVLPFANMSEDKDQEYFSDGITEDIITNLSKLSGIFVVSRNSTFLYKGKQVKIEEVARDLGVRHVLEGSVRRAGDRVRVSAQLIDGKTGQHLWADKYDRELKDIFSVQDDVTRKVVSELAIALTADEAGRLARKHTGNFEAYNLFLRARMEGLVMKNETDLRAMEMLRQVIDLDPDFAAGYQYLSYMLCRRIRFGRSASPREDLEKAFELAQKAISVDDKYPFSYYSLANVYLMQGKHDDALATVNIGVSLAPGNDVMLLWLGYYLTWAGRGEEAVAAVKKGTELNPMYLHGRNPAYLDYMGWACFTAGRYEESISNMKKAIEKFGSTVSRDPFLIASYSMLGRMEEAKESAQQWLKANPSFTLSSYGFGRLYKRSEDSDRLYEALRKAGLN
ncbi:MAG: adenylate/guanylate cyclase domain-containing protein [Thermodesulfobacteriota bacterium]